MKEPTGNAEMPAEPEGVLAPKVRWQEPVSDKDRFGDDWPEEEAIERQINETIEVRDALHRFIEDEANGDEDQEPDGIDIDEFLDGVEASAGKIGRVVTAATTTTNYTVPASTTTTSTNTANFSLTSKLSEASEKEKPGAILTPLDMSDAEIMDMGRFRKRVLPFADIHYHGRTLKFNKDLASKIAKNFKKKPFEQVVVNHVDEQNRHNDDPLKVMGEVRDLVVGEDGLYAEVETNRKGTEYLTEVNPNVGVSVRFLPNYTREWDGTHFGPCIQHAAITPDPHITDLGPWQVVNEMSGGSPETEKVWGRSVDLSRESYVDRESQSLGAEKGGEADVSEHANEEAKREEVNVEENENVDQNSGQNEESNENNESQESNQAKGEANDSGEEAGERKEEDQGAAGESAKQAEPVGQEAAAQDSGREGAEVNMSEQNAENIVELSAKLEAAERALKAVRGRERRQAIRHKLEKEYPGVAPFALSAAEEILLSADDTDEESFELSATGEAALKEGTIADPVKQLLDACTAKVDMSAERGTSRMGDQQTKDELSAAREKHDRDYEMFLRLAGERIPAEQDS